MENTEEDSKKIGKIQKKIVKWYEKYGRNPSWIVKRYGKCRRKVGWIVKWYGKYGRKVSWNVKRYGEYRRNPSLIVKWYGKYGRKVSWNDMENIEERQVE